MRIDQIDKNLANKGLRHDDYTWHTVQELTLCGCLDPERPMHRFDRRLAASLGERCAWLSGCTAGVRVRFYTDSPYIAISARLTQSAGEALLADMTPVNASGFDLYQQENGALALVGVFRPDGISDTVCCDLECYSDRYRLIEINFPLFNGVDVFALGLKAGSRLDRDTARRRRFLLYGSSITQGGCSSRPGNSYGALLSRLTDTDYINVGLSGNCLGQPEMARYLASVDTDLFILDFDHNSPGADYLESVYPAFFRQYREKRPDTPIIMLSMPLFNSDWLRASGLWEERRTDIIRNTYLEALAHGDENVYFIDGAFLIPRELADLCTHDQVHCNDMGFYYFAAALKPVTEAALNKKK